MMSSSLSKAAQAEIVALAANGSVTPKTVVSWAEQNADSALHRAFEWDNGKAGERYRLIQARAFLRLVVTVPENSPHTVRAFVSLQGDRGAAGYRGIESVMKDSDLRGQLIEQFLDDMRQCELRYRRVEELAKVFDAVDEVRSKRRGKREERTAA